MPSYPSAIGPRFPTLGRIAYSVARPIIRAIGMTRGLHDLEGKYARNQLTALQAKLANGKTIRIVGLGCGGHNSGIGAVEASLAKGIRIIANHEEERFRGVKHYKRFPHKCLHILLAQIREEGWSWEDVDAVVASWDYLSFSSNLIRSIAEEMPGGLQLMRPRACPVMDLHDISQAFGAPKRLGVDLPKPTPRQPIIGLRHHDNHAWLSYGVSPFASSSDPVMVAVLDGTGDDSSISLYVARDGQLERLFSNESIFDSVGQMYMYISSTQGGWPPLSSEGRYMGAAAWGNGDRLTNPYYQPLRQIFHFTNDGRVQLNRRLVAWHQCGSLRPYKRGLEEILGAPIPLDEMWNPDHVLSVEDIEHAPITRERVDKAAATQLVFEDALFHVIGHLIRRTGSTKLVITGGAALNCVANMRLLSHFDGDWYDRYLGRPQSRLHLWVPPIPGDAGAPVGAAYHFACLAGVPVGRPGMTLRHAFYCGSPVRQVEIEKALVAEPEIGLRPLGNIHDDERLERLADLIAYIVSHDGVVGIFQGNAETGPRALGHRSILANPANPITRQVLNELVKFREVIRPLAPMATLNAANRWFELAPGASDDDYNAYNYMVLTAQARPEAYDAIPAVIHRDGSSRVQIVREDIDPLMHAYLERMGHYIGAEVSVNTSLNVGSPIVQTPAQALAALKRSRGMDGLFFISREGDASVVWHDIRVPPKDGGKRLKHWLDGHAVPRQREKAAV